MSITESLALVVKTETAGTLETNITDLENFVAERIKDYAPESYAGDADAAKKDRAELNKAKRTLSDARKAVIARVMKPYADFESRCKNLEIMIDEASGKLDEIVKVKESGEKERKRNLIELDWNSREFNLVTLDKVFNPKWLNKTYKMSDIQAEITAIIEQIYKDLKTIERFAEDAETLKAHYLICLNIADTLDYGEELKKKRELAGKEAEDRAEREHEERILEQKKEFFEEQETYRKTTLMSSLVADALEEEIKEQAKEYTVTLRLYESELLGLKNYLNMQGIEYECRELAF